MRKSFSKSILVPEEDSKRDALQVSHENCHCGILEEHLFLSDKQDSYQEGNAA